MSQLDSYRSIAQRGTTKATKLQADIAGYQKEKNRKQSELARTTSPSRVRTLNKDIQRLDDKIAQAGKDIAAALGKASNYSEKVSKGEQKTQADAEKARKKALADQLRAQRRMQQTIDSTSDQVLQLDSRLSEVEQALLDQVHEAVLSDPVEREFDVFLSHTDPDKEIARELYQEFVARGLAVWFDGAEVILGKSVTRQIDRGIAKSKVAVILITEAFIKGRYWTELEMGGFFASRKRLIPVLDGVSRTDLSEYSPMLADMAGLDTDQEGFDLMAERIVATVRVE